MAKKQERTLIIINHNDTSRIPEYAKIAYQVALRIIAKEEAEKEAKT